jgi:hypothetical protein
VASGDFLGLSLWVVEEEVEAPDSIFFFSVIILLTLLSDRLLKMLMPAYQFSENIRYWQLIFEDGSCVNTA